MGGLFVVRWVSTVVPRSRPIFVPGRGAGRPPMPIRTRFLAGTLGMSVVWNQGVVCVRSSRSASSVSTCRPKWMMPRLPPSGCPAVQDKNEIRRIHYSVDVVCLAVTGEFASVTSARCTGVRPCLVGRPRPWSVLVPARMGSSARGPHLGGTLPASHWSGSWPISARSRRVIPAIASSATRATRGMQDASVRTIWVDHV